MFERVELVEYTRREELFNTVTHAAGVLFALVLGAVLLADTIGTGAWNRVLSAAVYALSLAVMYGASALYHGLPCGRLKKAARVVDHSLVFILLAGTATPCALISLMAVRPANAVFVAVFAWASAAVGVVSALLFFEKTKALRLVLNIATGLILFASVIPITDRLNPAGLGALWAGALIYAAGLVFFRLGKTRRYAHTVFHLFVLAGSAVHAYAMVVYIFNLR